MSTNYPNSLDTFPSSTTLASHTLSTDPHSVLHGNLGDALSALEIKVGINSSTVTGSLDYKVSHLLTRQVIAGSGLSGGGDLSSDVTLSLPSVGTANTYGDSTHYPIITTDSKGRVSSVTTQLVQGGVSSFNTRTGAITLTTSDVDAALPVDVVQTDIANTFTVGPQTIQTGGNSNKGLIVKANSGSQSGTLQEWQDSSGNLLAKVFSFGGFRTTQGLQVASNGAEILDAGIGQSSTKISAFNNANPVLIVQGAPSQSANLQEWQDSNGTVRVLINNVGTSTQLQLGPLTGGGVPNLNGISLDTSVGGTGGPRIRMFNSGNLDLNITCDNTGMHIDSPLSVIGTLTGVTDITVQTLAAKSASNPYVRIWLTGTHFFDWNASVANTLQLLNTSGTAIALFKEGAANVKFAVRGEVLQSVNLQEWQDSSSSVLSAILPNGSWRPPSISDGSATNNSLYYSTTQSKLVFKDSGGIANPLY